VVAYFHRFYCFDIACHRDGSGARQIAESLVLGSVPRRAVGASGASNSGRCKTFSASELGRSQNRLGTLAGPEIRKAPVRVLARSVVVISAVLTVGR
jgi:hypothetical protein